MSVMSNYTGIAKEKPIRSWQYATLVCTCGAAAHYERERVHLTDVKRELGAAQGDYEDRVKKLEKRK